MVLIGAGRVGAALAERAAAAGAPCTLVTRDQGWEALDQPPGQPILLLVRSDDLASVVPRVPERRRADLVVLQNGILRPALPALGLALATRGELYLAVARRGGPLLAPRPSPLFGPHAAPVADWLGRLGVPAREVDGLQFCAAEVLKTLWLVVFGQLGQARRQTVGALASEATAEVEALLAELLPVARAGLSVDLPLSWALDQTLGYAREIPEFACAVREWRWRDGWFVATAQRRGQPLPVHRGWCARNGIDPASGPAT